MEAKLNSIVVMLVAIFGMTTLGVIQGVPTPPAPIVIPVPMPLPLFPPRPKPKPEPYMETFGISEKLAVRIIFYADKHDIDTDLAFGLIHVESGFNRYATSKTGARGLTQLLRSTAGDYVSNPTNDMLYSVDENLDVGMLYMRLMLDRFGNVSTALEAYNRGPNRVGRMLRDDVPFHRNYSRTVLAVAERMAD